MAASGWGKVHLSRRHLLVGAVSAMAGSAVASCGRDVADRPGSSLPRSAGTPPAGGPVAGGDVALAEAVIRDEELLLNFGRRCRDAHPELAAFLAGWTRRQVEHVAALRDALTESDPVPNRSAPKVPGSPAAAAEVVLELLTRGERRRRRDCLRAQAGGLARLLGSMSASHAVSAELVRPLT